MLGSELHSPGYHTTLPDGIWSHSTRDALDYAQLLLAAGDADRVSRAHDVIGKILELQDTDPTARTYGIWSWFLEEPLSKMSPPDWNWADFCGARLADMLVDYESLLAKDLAERIRISLGHAAWSIFRRNVQPDYTNISIMGAAVALAAGELLFEPRLIQYGRLRLRRQLEHVQYHGGFQEYNSPTYTVVAVAEIERILRLVRDPEARDLAVKLHVVAWETIASHYHPATGQWAGPHSRAYSDWLQTGTAQFLSARTGAQIPVRTETGELSQESFDNPLPCPSGLAPLFAASNGDDLEVRSRFLRRDPDSLSTYGVTWLSEHACLGSISSDIMWTQRRVLLGYWRSDEDPAVCLRLRFLHDGRDFSSAVISNAQDTTRILSLVGFVLGRGDFHPSLDCPRDNIFHGADFRMRYQLAGAGASVKQTGECTYELSAGAYRAVVNECAGWFDGAPIRWEMGQEQDTAYVDAVCYAGRERDFDFRTLGTSVIAAGMELLATGQTAVNEMPSLSVSPDNVAVADWNLHPPLSVTHRASPRTSVSPP